MYDTTTTPGALGRLKSFATLASLTTAKGGALRGSEDVTNRTCTHTTDSSWASKQKAIYYEMMIWFWKFICWAIHNRWWKLKSRAFWPKGLCQLLTSGVDLRVENLLLLSSTVVYCSRIKKWNSSNSIDTPTYEPLQQYEWWFSQCEQWQRENTISWPSPVSIKVELAITFAHSYTHLQLMWHSDHYN